MAATPDCSIWLELQPSGPGHEWLQEAAEAFERERLHLVRLTSAVGPMPRTPGAAETEASLLAQRHAIETLAQIGTPRLRIGRRDRAGRGLARRYAAFLDKAATRSASMPRSGIP